MTRWVGESPRKPPPGPPDPRRVTDDPLAALGLNGRDKNDLQVYAVSRVNPLFNLPSKCPFDQHHPPPSRDGRNVTHTSQLNFDEYVREKSPEIDYDDDTKLALRHYSVSSGYSGSSGSENGFMARLRPAEEVAILDQNPAFVKSIRIAGRGLRTTKTVPSQHSSSSGAGTLSTIPEGRVDASVPLPVWPGSTEDALLLYARSEVGTDVTIRDLLMDLLTSIGQARSPEDAVRQVDEKIRRQLEVLRSVTEEDMRRLCVSLSKGRQVNSVLRALSRSPSSGLSSTSGRVRTCSFQEDELYHIPSGSSSSGFSDSPPGLRRPPTPLSYGRKPSVLVSPLSYDGTSTLSRGIRNALIYGTLCRQKTSPVKETVAVGDDDLVQSDKTKNCDRKELLGDRAAKLTPLGSVRDNKPSVWELYYGVRAEGSTRYGQGKPSDIPVFHRFPTGTIPPPTGLKPISPRLEPSMGAVASPEANGVALIKPRGAIVAYLVVAAREGGRWGAAPPAFITPGGRPEADFTLDLPRSELLSKRLKEDKKWRFRCRLLTSFLGLVFFLLSVMAVSMILTRGKRMFGSMV